MSDVPEVGLQPTPQPPARSWGKAVGLGIGALAVVAGGAFAALSLASEDSSSPEEPVRALLEALDRGDVLGALEQLEPGERDALREPMIDLVDALNELEVLEGASLERIEGIDVGFEDVELASEEVGDGIARVTIERGTASYSFEPGRLPLGDFVTQFFDPAELEASADEEPIEPDEESFVATVERGGRWYVSVGYTIAEQARQQAGISFDQLGEGIEAEGADSPEGAVEELLAAVEAKDLRRGLALLAPGEMGALQRYAELFLDDVPEGVFEEAEVEIGDPELEVVGDGDRRKVLVSIRSFRAVDEGVRVEYEDGCLTIEDESQPTPQEVCSGDDPFAALGAAGFPVDMFGMPPFPELSIVSDPPQVGIIVTEVDGEWYLSPVGTAVQALADTLGALERTDLDAIVAWVGALQSAFLQGAARFEGATEG